LSASRKGVDAANPEISHSGGQSSKRQANKDAPSRFKEQPSMCAQHQSDIDQNTSACRRPSSCAETKWGCVPVSDDIRTTEMIAILTNVSEEF
jgi:hypothetical protein